MKNIFWLGLFGIFSMGMSGVGKAAPEVVVDTAPASTVSAAGTVVQVKAEQDRVKINHDPIPALGWPRMTMYFRVKDKAVLEGVSAGDKVRFEMEKGATGLVITRMEKVAK